MQLKHLIVVFLLSLAACQQNPPKEANETHNQSPGFQITIDEFNQFLYRKADMLPKVHIDSIVIKDKIYSVYITDTMLNHINKVNIIQNANIILKDFCCFKFESIPFNQIRVAYQVPLRDNSGYFEIYRGSVENTKYSLRLFSNLSFSNIMKEIVLLHQEFPKEDVLGSLNMGLAIVVSQEDDKKLEWFGIDCTNLVIGYLLECEQKKGDYNKKKLDSVLEFIIGKKEAKEYDVRVKIVKRIRKAFEENCKTLKNMPIQKVEEKVIAL